MDLFRLMSLSLLGLYQIPTDEPGKIKLEGVIFMIAMMKVLAITVALFSAADTDASGVLEVR